MSANNLFFSLKELGFDDFIKSQNMPQSLVPHSPQSLD